MNTHHVRQKNGCQAKRILECEFLVLTFCSMISLFLRFLELHIENNIHVSCICPMCPMFFVSRVFWFFVFCFDMSEYVSICFWLFDFTAGQRTGNPMEIIGNLWTSYENHTKPMNILWISYRIMRKPLKVTGTRRCGHRRRHHRTTHPLTHTHIFPGSIVYVFRSSACRLELRCWAGTVWGAESP